MKYPDVYDYLPEPDLELPKWVKEQVENRHEKVADKKDIMIKMDPRIADIFQQSVAVSSKFANPKLILKNIYFKSVEGSVCELAPGR